MAPVNYMISLVKKTNIQIEEYLWSVTSFGRKNQKLCKTHQPNSSILITVVGENHKFDYRIFLKMLFYFFNILFYFIILIDD